MPFSFNPVSRSITTQLNLKFILLINVKMPTIVGILTFISRITTQSESSKGRKILLIYIFQHFSFYEVELQCLVEINMKIFLQSLGQNLVDFHFSQYQKLHCRESKLSNLLVCLILYVPSTIFQLNRDGSSWAQPVLS